MAGSKARSRSMAKRRVPRIRPAEAEQIFEQLEDLLEQSVDLLENLRHAGIGALLHRLEDSCLELALQPGAWGERTKARLMSDIVPSLSPSDDIDKIVHVANIVMPCLLLELGRRKQHIQVEFPANPVQPGVHFKLSIGPFHTVHLVRAERLLQLVHNASDDLVGLCYFGDQASRARIEKELSKLHARSRVGPSLSEIKH